MKRLEATRNSDLWFPDRPGPNAGVPAGRKTCGNGPIPERRRQAIDLLFAENASCVVCNGEQTLLFRERGVKDLFRLLESRKALLEGAFVADRVVGKGAAALMILGGVKEVFADVISRPARALFRRARIRVEFTLEVPHIVNRTKSGWCPVETLCKDCETAEACLPLIRRFIESNP